MSLKQQVREFWNDNPLFTGESTAKIGTKEWFMEHESVIFNDCMPYGIESIYTEGIGPDSNILDVGCGPGFWVRYFLSKGFANVSACDLTPKAVELTTTSLNLFNLHTTGRICEGDAESLPFANDSFDHVNCQGVIHHTPNTSKCIEEFCRVLKPGGTACFSVYHKNILLRNPALLSIISKIFKNIISLKGRGRERILTGDPDELVRRYDGINNPVGKSYTYDDILEMTKPFFKINKTQKTFFPARAFPFKIPRAVHRYLHRKHGLLIVVHMTKFKS
jgi:ubiquinone/menaquinone biosynthesis C-methylase UbiE